MAKKNKNRSSIKQGIKDREEDLKVSVDSKLDNKYSNVDNMLAESESLYINGDFDWE